MSSHGLKPINGSQDKCRALGAHEALPGLASAQPLASSCLTPLTLDQTLGILCVCSMQTAASALAVPSPWALCPLCPQYPPCPVPGWVTLVPSTLPHSSYHGVELFNPFCSAETTPTI